MIKFGIRVRNSVVFPESQYWNVGLRDLFRVRNSFGDKGIEGIEVPCNWNVSMTLRESTFLRVRNSVGFQVPEHCSVALISSVRVNIRALIRLRVRDCAEFSLPFSCSMDLKVSIIVHLRFSIGSGVRMYETGI